MSDDMVLRVSTRNVAVGKEMPVNRDKVATRRIVSTGNRIGIRAMRRCYMYWQCPQQSMIHHGDC